ncbi:hypothetical protein JNW88_32140, partial [Micromonospora sp. ATA32]|nr:hypothetical protein [Micromonospora sp. ATA32]
AGGRRRTGPGQAEGPCQADPRAARQDRRGGGRAARRPEHRPAGGGPDQRGTTDGASARRAAPNESTPTSEPARRPPPGRARTVREIAAEFAALIDQAQARGEIDPDTAENLREAAAELDRGKPKDRAKRIRELRDKIAEAADEQRIGSDTAARLQDLLTAYGRVRGGGADEG